MRNCWRGSQGSRLRNGRGWKWSGVKLCWWESKRISKSARTKEDGISCLRWHALHCIRMKWGGMSTGIMIRAKPGHLAENECSVRRTVEDFEVTYLLPVSWALAWVEAGRKAQMVFVRSLQWKVRMRKRREKKSASEEGLRGKNPTQSQSRNISQIYRSNIFSTHKVIIVLKLSSLSTRWSPFLFSWPSEFVVDVDILSSSFGTSLARTFYIWP